MKSLIQINLIRRLSQAASEKLRTIPHERLIWRANEDDPRKHNDSHEGLFYVLPEERERISIFGYPTPFDEKLTKLHETLGLKPIMIRKPTLTAMKYIEKVQPDMPNVRIVFYSNCGHGKKHSLYHLLHYLHLKQEHVIVQIPSMKQFTLWPREFDVSTSRPGRINTNTDAALFLQQFRIQNAQIFEKLKISLVCSKNYKWSQREENAAGSPLISVAEHGVNRVIHASDCAAVLIKELILAADEGKIKVASVLDEAGNLFQREAGRLKHPDKKKMLVEEITVARALKKMIRGNQKNWITLAAVSSQDRKQLQTPSEIIGEDGWRHLDPFLPIHLPKYSRKEFESCMNMYQDLGWLTRPETKTVEARDELWFMSGKNPRELRVLCRSL